MNNLYLYLYLLSGAIFVIGTAGYFMNCRKVVAAIPNETTSPAETEESDQD